MNRNQYIVALDQGTTSSRAIIFNYQTEIVGIAQREFKQHYPQAGWVEHDADEIFETQYEMLLEVIGRAEIKINQIAAIGITNQRETTVVWNKETGKPIHKAIVWQCRRTAGICRELKDSGWQAYIKEKTGLIIDPYFSATKIKWILDQTPNARVLADQGKLLFGTIDTWLIWRLTNGKQHLTDYTNASRTMLFDINTMQWDKQILKELNIPMSMMPEVKQSSGHFGEVELDGDLEHKIPITGVAGDQQSALFGQMCIEPGMAKNTYGTGCFLLMNTGQEKVNSNNGLLTTIACGPTGEPCYAIEGSVFMAGAAIQWLRDEMGLLANSQDSEKLATSVDTTDDVYLVPAFTGLGAPHWDPYAKGIVVGLTRGSHANHLIRATLESIAYQTFDVIHTMQMEAQLKLSMLRVDGGGVNNDFLMQFQADILGVDVHRTKICEVTALGAAYLAGIGVGFWQTLTDISRGIAFDRKFTPQMSDQRRHQLYYGWQKAVKCAKLYAELNHTASENANTSQSAIFTNSMAG